METTHRAFAAVTAVSLGLMAMVPALAASDYLLELDSVEGEVATKTTIELASWSFGASNPTSVGSSGMSSGRRQHQPVRVSTPVAENGSVSVVTAREAGSGMATGRRACASGTHFPTATLSRGSQRWALTDVMVSSCASDGMTLSYRSIATYDLKTNKK
jgi:hypothetical protein